MNIHEDESELDDHVPRTPNVTLRISADGKAILFLFRPEDYDPTDLESEGSFYDLCFSEIKSRGIPHWRDHLSRKNWFGDEQHRQFFNIIESFLP